MNFRNTVNRIERERERDSGKKINDHIHILYDNDNQTDEPMNQETKE